MFTFGRHRKRDSFGSMDIEDRICTALEYKLNVVRYDFISKGIPIVKKETLMEGITWTVEVYMHNLRNVDIHMSLVDTNKGRHYIISDIWSRIETKNCREAGVYGICLEVKNLIIRKKCRQLFTTLGYLFKRKFLKSMPDTSEPKDPPIILNTSESVNTTTNITSSVRVQGFPNVTLDQVVFFNHLPVIKRLNWFLDSNFTKEEMREIVRLSDNLESQKNNDTNYPN